MDLLASRHSVDLLDLCLKVKWMIYAVRSNGASDPNQEPPIFQGSVLGHPLLRDHRIAVGGSRQEERCWRSACSRPGAGKTSNTGQSASKRGLTRGGKPSAPDHESP